MGAPAGPAGCHRSNADSADTKPHFQVAASYGQSWSHLHFSDDFEPTLNQQTVVGSFVIQFKERFTLMLSGGAIVTGELRDGVVVYEQTPGGLISIRFGVLLLVEKRVRPFLMLSLTSSLGVSNMKGDLGNKERFIGTDMRLGLTVGYTFFKVWRLYLSPRVFGGPIFWEHDGSWERGRDRFFFQAGMGTGVLFPIGLSLFVDGSPAGEQTISVGVAWEF